MDTCGPATGLPAASFDVGAVRAAARAYEEALVDGDTAAAAAFFASREPVTRFGPEGAQFGRDEVAALRAATAPVPAGEWLHDEVRPLSPGVALHLAVLRRGEGPPLLRTQVWVELADGWRITHAHVSRPLQRVGGAP